MKRLVLSLVIAVMGIFSSFGMSFSEAQQQAYFLTDKMAYELDLTPSQYDQVYQVNLEYFLNVSNANPYNHYWDYRNTDLSYILFDWQYLRYRAAAYFYRPIQWRSSSWYFPIWERYHRTYYFFSRPTVWNTWRGGLWHNRVHNTPSPFIGHRPPQHNGGMYHNLKPGAHHQGNPGGKPGNNYYNYGNNHNNRPGYNGGNNGYNRPDNNRPNGGNNSYNNRPDNNRPNGGNNGYNNRPDNNRPNGGNGSYNGGGRNNVSSSPRGSYPSSSRGAGNASGSSRGAGRR